MSELRLNYNQSFQQQMRLSPQMVQSINLLSLPLEDLHERLYEEAEKNPALEIINDGIWEPPSIRVSAKSGSAAESDAHQAFLESTPAAQESLQEHLLSQLALLPLSDDERQLGERIIQNLNDRGYNASDPASLLGKQDSTQSLKKMLGIVRRLDPVGTACADLQESLAVQAEQHTDAPFLALDILKHHFTVLEKKRAIRIRKALAEQGVQCTLEQTEQALEFIRSLNPFPASRFDKAGSENGIRFAVPEVSVRKATDEEREETGNTFIIEFLKENIPHIGISPLYESIAQNKTDKSSQHFALEALRDARQFIHALNMRTKTLTAAVYQIVLHQSVFFEKGPGNLIPLKMKDIAEKIGVHETTVSRLANGKYIQCEWGIFEIKYFFTNAATANRSTAASNTVPLTSPVRSSISDSIPASTEPVAGSKEAVKYMLQKIITNAEKENSKKLSDAQLVTLLEKQGVHIARRTVAKYRNELHIESSFDR
ncbi:RNA polymerase factor sigma-54 [Treponema lecithinolyticum]